MAEKAHKTLFDRMREEFHKERNTKAFYRTQGFKKPWLALKAILKTDTFQKTIGGLRDKYKVPPGGFRVTENPWTHPPKEWDFYHKDDFWKRMRVLERIRHELEATCLEYGFPPKDFVNVLEHYLFYDRSFITLEPNSHNLIYVTDLATRCDSLGRELTDVDIKTHPVALLLSPYVSERDLLDYIRKIYTTEIRPIQHKYRKPGSEIGRHRTKKLSIQKRNEFILRLRDRRPKEIKKLLWEKLHTTMKSGHISKVLSLEKVRRK